MKKKSICLINPETLPVPATKGGAIETLLTSLINQNEINHKLDITIASPYDKTAVEESKRYKYAKFIYIKTGKIFFLKKVAYKLVSIITGYKLSAYNQAVLSKIKKREFDYVVAEDGAFSAFRSYLRYFERDKMVLHFHHSGPSTKEADLTFGHFIGVSEFVKKTFQSTSSISDCLVLKNGIKLANFQQKLTAKDKLNLRKTTGIDENDIVVLYVGRIVEVKGVLELIQATKLINNPNIKLLIVGSVNFGGKGSSAFEERVYQKMRNSNGRIMCTGYVENRFLYKYHQIADIGVMPSICDEAAGLVGIEMTASGLPLVVTESGGLPEYVGEGNVVLSKFDRKKLVHDLSEAILDLSNRPQHRKRLSTLNKRHAALFSEDKYYANFIETLRSIRQP